VFFVDLHTPWVYFWMYGGAVMRLTLCAEEARAASPAQVPTTLPGSGKWLRTRGLARDAYGWMGAQGRKLS
jgi:hypothetical protein